MILSRQRSGVLTRHLQQMPKPMLYLFWGCGGGDKGGEGDLTEEVRMFLTTEITQKQGEKENKGASQVSSREGSLSS